MNQVSYYLYCEDTYLVLASYFCFASADRGVGDIEPAACGGWAVVAGTLVVGATDEAAAALIEAYVEVGAAAGLEVCEELKSEFMFRQRTLSS